MAVSAATCELISSSPHGGTFSTRLGYSHDGEAEGKRPWRQQSDCEVMLGKRGQRPQQAGGGGGN